MAIKYLEDLDLNGKSVLVRVDFNVPMDSDLNITDDTRIKATLPTLEHCLKENAKLIIISHLGRPKGKVVPNLSLGPVAKRLSELIGKDVAFVENSIDEAKAITEEMSPGEIALLENIRFYPEEEKDDEGFGEKLAGLADIYINDAFAAAHRGHASNETVTKYVNECGAGFLLKNEIEYFKKVISNPDRPLVAIIGGAKISSKLAVLKNLLSTVDHLIIGGGMAFTFLKAREYNIGTSIFEEDLVDTALEILELGVGKIILPEDIVISPKFDNDAPSSIVSIDKIPEDMMGLDIGPKSIKAFSEVIKKAKTIVWNGPMGAFEMESFSKGTIEVGKLIAASGALSVIGGGDSVTAVKKYGLADKMSYISTGGGAFLELLEGRTLPALAALDR